MIKLGLTRAQERNLRKLLVRSHRITVRLQVLTLEHEAIGDLSKRLMGGQLNIDDTSDVTRSLELDLIDPFGQINMASDSPDEGALFADRMIRCVVNISSPTGDEDYDIPIFTGPVSKVDRDGKTLKVTCLGKESLSLAALWRGKTFKKNTEITLIIKRIMAELAGEHKFDIVTRDKKTPKPISLGRSSAPWKVAKALARSINLQLFYDGRGVLRLRPIPASSTFTFTDRNASLLSDPQATFSQDGLINAVEVIGSKKNKHNIHFRIVAKRSHPFSPWKLGRNGVPRFLPLQIKEDSIKSNEEARTIGKRALADGLLQGVELAFDALPVYFLEEGDVCRVESDKYIGRFKFNKASMPLTCDGRMSVGYNKRVTPLRHSVRVRSKRNDRSKRGR